MAGTDYWLHTVAPGETVYSLSRLYGVDEERLYEDNPSVRAAGLKAGETVRIYCDQVPRVDMPRRRMQRTFITHTVVPGETTYSIAKSYSLSLNTLVQDNPGLDPAHLRAGQEILIRKSEIDKTSPQTIRNQMDEFASTLSDVSDDTVYHVVEMGETLYSLGRRYGVPVERIEAANDLGGGLKAGTIIRIPAAGAQSDKAAAPQPLIPAPQETAPLPGGDLSADPQTDVPAFAGIGDRLDVAMLLPLTRNGAARTEMVEFYRGTLLALEELRGRGVPIALDLYDTRHTAERVGEIVASGSLDGADLIIGPVYESGMDAVAGHARRIGATVVSPLAAVDGSFGSVLFQLAPDEEYRKEKLSRLFDGDKNIVFITSDVNDAALEREMKAAVGDRHYQRIVYTKGTPSQRIDRMLADGDNVFVVTAGDETGVDLVLAALSSVQNSRLSRSIRTGRIEVVGNSRWLHYRNLDRNLFFKLNVSFLATYHADRGDEAVRKFDARYMEAYGQLPSLYSYRGYDAMMLFGGAMLSGGSDLPEALNAQPVPLQTPYRFGVASDGNVCNTFWPAVTYRSDYTITVR